MWSSCHPKTDDDLNECAELGKSLNRLSQPTILTLLAQSKKPMHGYIIVQQAAASPMFGGKKARRHRHLPRPQAHGGGRPGVFGVGHARRRVGQALFTLTDKGYRCLRRWIDALACYELTIEELRADAARALDIELPDTPQCAH